MRGQPHEISKFCEWFASQPHRHKIVIAGNGDLALDASSCGVNPLVKSLSKADSASCRAMLDNAEGVEYLCDQGTTILGITVWGSPWSPEFHIGAFNLPRGERCRERWKQIPADTDIVVTHVPPLGHGDLCRSNLRAGCLDLLDELQTRVRPRYHVFGHIHEGYGATTDGQTTFLNASTCSLRYKPENNPLVFDVMPLVASPESQS